MKKLLCMLAALLLLTGCAEERKQMQEAGIYLSDEGVTVQGYAADAVYTENDIIYYPTGMDVTFGEGTEDDAHDKAEADAHTVVHIAKPGTYRVTGTLPAGQIAVDLGEDAEDDPEAVVTLVLDNADITCTVAPAVIFYNVYECGDKDEPSETVDTAAAGANVILEEGSINYVTGSYVAKIYKEGTVELSEDGTEVRDAKKLHKYDAALYSKMSMNVGGSGKLYITAENEGLDTELHLTVNGGEVYIRSGNDGINTNEDGVSVTTINGGLVDITVTGETGEGDGIDSNGWLVINGGEVRASACGFSMDAGIDSDMGIFLNGGKIAVSGHMLDRIEGGTAHFAVFSFAQEQEGGQEYTLKTADGQTVVTVIPENSFSVLILSDDALAEGDYTLCRGAEDLFVATGSSVGGRMPPADLPEGERPELPEGFDLPEGERPEPPEGFDLPEGERPEQPEGIDPGGKKFPEGQLPQMGESATVFTVKKGENYFTVG